MHRLIVRCATPGPELTPLKRRQRFAKYEQTLLQCGDDIKSLQRFVDGQVVAFRKILKKYRKWTGSSTLGSRFKQNILSQPKSFTRRKFSQLQSQYEGQLSTLHDALPTEPPGGICIPEPESKPSRQPTAQLSPSETIVAVEPQPPSGSWNEYECGSEAGDFDCSADTKYAIYVDHNEDFSLHRIKALSVFLARPTHKIAFHPKSTAATTNDDPERNPLLSNPPRCHSLRAARSPPDLGYFSNPPGYGSTVITTTTSTTTTAAGTETDLDEDDRTSSRFFINRHSLRGSGSFSRGYTSSSDDQQQLFLPTLAYSTHYAAGYTLPSITEQRVARCRDQVLLWATWGCFGAAFVLMGIAGVLIAIGRHKTRSKVDAGATVGIMTSLGAACAGLCMTGSRRDKIGWVGRAALRAAFAVMCVVNGVLLMLVMGNTGLLWLLW